MRHGCFVCLAQSSQQLVKHLTIFALLFTVALSLQLLSGAYSGAFGQERDEAAHYVTALMIRDYVVAGFPADPMEYAKDYYARYPRVAFGIWPPVFHLLTAGWMLVFGPGRVAVLLLMALCTACWGYFLFRLVLPHLSLWWAVLSALVLVAIPPTQRSTTAVMLDIPTAVLILLAGLVYARYLATERIVYALGFGLIASAAILTKYNGALLALVPPIAVGLTARFYLLRRWSFWAPALVVLAIAGPWYWSMRHLVAYAAEPGQGEDAIWFISLTNLLTLLQMAGPIALGLAVVGAVEAVRLARRNLWERAASGWADAVVAIAVLVATWIFHSLMYPIVGFRYLLPAAPCVIFLAVLGLRSLLRSVVISSPGKAGVFASVAGFIAFMPGLAFSVPLPKKDTAAFVLAAEKALEQPLVRDGVILVSSAGSGEGMLVAEIAMRDRGRARFVARASKLFADSHLMGHDYRLLYQTPHELIQALDEIPVSVAVVEECTEADCDAHHRLLSDAIRDVPSRWCLAGQFVQTGKPPLRIYTLSGNEGKSLKSIRINMQRTLHDIIEVKR